jgi:trk system potassium uptake protein TrkH
VTTALLIIIGGISYLVISDVFSVRKWTRFSLDTKFILVTTGALLLTSMFLIAVTGWNDTGTLNGMSFPQKTLNAFFQSVTARTAGFSTIDMGACADCTLFLTMLLMFIGGASGSTAGGIKVNTFGLLVATAWSSVKGKEKAGAFGRSFNTVLIYRAVTVIIVSLGIVTLSVFLLTMTENAGFLNLLFESFSAFGTVGLSTGITPELTVAGRIIIIGTMFVGRLGPLTLVLALVQRQKTTAYRFPEEQIRIG